MLILCLDFTQGMLTLNPQTGKTYSDEVLENLESTLESLFKPRKDIGHFPDSPTDFCSRYSISSINLTVLTINEYSCKCILFNKETTRDSISEVASIIRSSPYVKHQMMDCARNTPIDVLYNLCYQCLFLIQNMDDSYAKSILLISRCTLLSHNPILSRRIRRGCLSLPVPPALASAPGLSSSYSLHPRRILLQHLPHHQFLPIEVDHSLYLRQDLAIALFETLLSIGVYPKPSSADLRVSLLRINGVSISNDSHVPTQVQRAFGSVHSLFAT